MVLLEVGAQSPLEVGVTTEEPGGGEDILDSSNDRIFKVTVEDRRVSDVEVVLQTGEDLLVGNGFFVGQEEVGTGNIDPSWSGADDDEHLEKRLLSQISKVPSANI